MVWIFLDKPPGIRSMQALAIIKKALGIKKAGTLGILDQFASGLLPIATEKNTKEIHSYSMEGKKEYIFNIKWGISTNTGDYTGTIMEDFNNQYNQPQEIQTKTSLEEGEEKEEGNIIDHTMEGPHEKNINIRKEDIINILPAFLGWIQQVPPIFSNIKINGIRAHKIARNGEIPPMVSRAVYVEKIELLQLTNNEALFLCVVGSGTYIRALATDMGKMLKIPCHLNYLRRTRIIFSDKVIYPTIDLQYYLNLIEQKN